MICVGAGTLSTLSIGALFGAADVTPEQIQLNAVEMIAVIAVTGSAAWTAAWWLAKRDRKIDQLEAEIKRLIDQNKKKD